MTHTLSLHSPVVFHEPRRLHRTGRGQYYWLAAMYQLIIIIAPHSHASRSFYTHLSCYSVVNISSGAVVCGCAGPATSWCLNLINQPKLPRTAETPVKTIMIPYPVPYAPPSSRPHGAYPKRLSLIGPLTIEPRPRPAPNRPISTPISVRGASLWTSAEHHVQVEDHPPAESPYTNENIKSTAREVANPQRRNTPIEDINDSDNSTVER